MCFMGYAFLLSLLAGLSTAVGGLLPLFQKKISSSFLCFSLGLSAGVMVYVSFMEILPESIHMLSGAFGDKLSGIIALGCFFLGMLVIAMIDRFVPEEENPHEFGREFSLQKMGLFSALVIAIHNFPEGLATFLTAYEDPSQGISIAIAIALHNIPEGITVAAPIYHATGRKGKAFGMSLLSGIAEPIGALVGFLLLKTLFTADILAYVYAAVAGIMIYLSFDEILPTAETYGRHHLVIWGILLGMLIMGVSLALL